MGPSKLYYSKSSQKLLVEEIMEEDLSKGGEDGKNYFVEDEKDMECEVGADPKNVPSISQFLRLSQREVQAPKVLYEPLVDHSLIQVIK